MALQRARCCHGVGWRLCVWQWRFRKETDLIHDSGDTPRFVGGAHEVSEAAVCVCAFAYLTLYVAKGWKIMGLHDCNRRV